MSEEIQDQEMNENSEITNAEKIDRIERSIENVITGIQNLKDKNSKIIFFVSDTEGHARGSVINVYQQAETLISLGYNVIMLYEKPDALKPSTWGKKSFDEIPMSSIQDKDALKVSSGDILIVPEIHADILQKTESLPLHRIIYIQSHEYMLDNFQIGKVWTDYGVFDVITTNESIVDLIKNVGHSNKVNLVKPYIPEEFNEAVKATPIKKPIITIYSRDQRKTVKIIKQFTTKYPMYRWVNFADGHGTHHESMPKVLAESMLAVWNDNIASYGRFALEALHANTPVVGVLPDIPQEWMTDENGIWVSNDNDIADIIATYIKQWTEDNIDVLENVKDTVANVGKYDDHVESVKTTFEDIVSRRIEFLDAIKDKYEVTLEELKSENKESVDN